MDIDPYKTTNIDSTGGDPFGASAYKKLSRPGCGLILCLVAIAWIVEIADQVFGFIGLPLDALGIRPRKMSGLPGIFLSPWLHGNWGHLFNNTFAFLGLGFLMVIAEGKRFLRTSFLLILISGFGTWLIGRGGSVHIGASGLIYGYFGYFLLRAWTERKPIWVVGGILVSIFYGGMVWGILPTDERVSWEAHFCGFIGGLWLGRNHGLLSKSRESLPTL